MILCDASFAGPTGAERRTAGASPTPDLAAALAAAPNLTALFAAQAHQGAHVLGAARGGLFTELALRGLRGEADALGDGRVDTRELATFLERELPSRAGLEGFDQAPFLVAPSEPAPAAEAENSPNDAEPDTGEFAPNDADPSEGNVERPRTTLPPPKAPGDGAPAAPAREGAIAWPR